MPYELTFTTKALEFIEKKHQSQFPDEDPIIILAETHSLGGVVSIEVLPESYRFSNAMDAFDEFFPKNYKNYPFATFIDHQFLQEKMVPEQMSVDFHTTVDGKDILTLKNPKFE
ncbi:MAG: hypothetical protein ACTSVL_04425 [Promethearchaeota archaeon]